MKVRTLACRFLSGVTLLALLWSSAPVTAGPILSRAEGPVPGLVGGEAEGLDLSAGASVPLGDDDHTGNDSAAYDGARVTKTMQGGILRPAGGPNAGWEEVGAGSASSGGISNSSGNSWVPSLAIAPDGLPYVAWYDLSDSEGDAEIYLRRWNGSSWGEVGTNSASSGGISNNSADSGSPSMAVAPDGTPYVAWADEGGGDWEIYVRRWNGSVWEEVGAGSASNGGISANIDNSYAPSIAIAPDGTPYVAWYDWSVSEYENSEIYVRRWNGSSWEEVGTGSASGRGVSDSDGKSWYPSIAIAPDGTPYVTWEEETLSAGGWDVEIYVRRWNGSSWEEVGAGSASGGGISDNESQSGSPSIAIAQNGAPYVAWHDWSGPPTTEIYVRRWNGSSWEEVGAGSASGGGISNNTGHSSYPSIAITLDNTPYVAWHDQTEGTEIYVRRWNGSIWEEVGVGSASDGGISNNDGSSVGACVAVTGDIPYIAWGDGSGSGGNSEIYVRRWIGAGVLIFPTTLDFGIVLTELPLSINPEDPTDTWTLNESIPWLALSSTGGTGSATVTARVDRSGLAPDTYSGTINATVGGQAVTVDVSMVVPVPVLVSPTTLDFGARLMELTLSITPQSATDAWTLSEGIPWLSLSSTSGTGPATVTASVDRGGLSDGHYASAIVATVGGVDVTINVAMDVITPRVDIVTPLTGSTFYHSAWMLVKAAVTLEGQPLVGAQVKGRIILGYVDTLPVAVPIAMYDDGDHFDGNADDGIYAGDVVLYGSGTMPVNDNPYLLTVMATADSGSGSDSVNINLAASDGAPTVAVEVSGPRAPDYFVGEQATVTATLTYPDSSIHTGTAVTLTVTAPDLSVTRVGLANVADDTWRGTYTFDQGGTTYLDVRADPPASTQFVDGWATATPALYVYQGALDLTLKTSAGPWPLYSRVPLSVCVTLGTQSISDATVDARFTAPAARDGGQLDEVGTTGCYRRDDAAQTPGTHIVVIQAQRPAYKTGTITGTFQVSDQPAVLSDTIQTFETWTIWDMEHGLAHVIQAADDGDYFKEKMEVDEFKLIVQGFVDLLGVASAATAPVHIPSAILFPGWKVVGKEMAGLVSDEVIAALIVEGSTAAERKRVNAAAMTYFATGGNPSRTLPGSDVLEAVTNEYYVIIPVGESLADNFAQVLSNTVDVNRARFITRVDETLADLPTLTGPEQTAYVTDLIARQDANEWLGVRDLRYQTNFLNAVRNKREEDEHNYVKIVVMFVAETAVKGVAFYFADGPGLAAANAAALAWHAYLNSEAVKEDQRMRDLALAIAHAGYRAEAILYTNSTSALSLIRDKTPPPTPDGAMLSVDLHRTTDWLGFARDVYADVQIENTGPIPAHFGVKAYFQKPDETLRIVEGLTNPATGGTMPVVELASHDSQTLRMYFKKDGEYDHGVPRRGEPIRFNLYAYTDYGAWLVHGMPGVEYRPTPTAALVQGVSMVGALGDLQIAGMAPDEDTPFPLLARVGSSPGSITYTLAVYASNPYPQPLATMISQTLPTEVQVLNAYGGVADGDQIVWYAIIQPREQAVLRYDFAYAGYGVTATLPAVNMSFYDPASSTTVVLTGQPSSFHTRTPLWAQATADLQVAPATQQTVSVTVSNLDTAAGRQGNLILRVTDITGTEVLRTTASVSLEAGGSRDYDLAYTAPDEGLYVLEVALHYGDETTPVICDLLQVRENRVYLPVVLRNQRP